MISQSLKRMLNRITGDEDQNTTTATGFTDIPIVTQRKRKNNKNKPTQNINKVSNDEHTDVTSKNSTVPEPSSQTNGNASTRSNDQLNRDVTTIKRTDDKDIPLLNGNSDETNNDKSISLVPLVSMHESNLTRSDSVLCNLFIQSESENLSDSRRSVRLNINSKSNSITKYSVSEDSLIVNLVVPRNALKPIKEEVYSCKIVFIN